MSDAKREREDRTAGQQKAMETHVEQLRVIELLVQRELIRAGVVPGPARSGWTLDEAYPQPPGAQPPGTVLVRGAVPGEILGPDIPKDPSILSTETSEPLQADAREAAVLELKGRPAAVLGAAIIVRDALNRSQDVLRAACERLRAFAKVTRDLDDWLGANVETLGRQLHTAVLLDRVEIHGTSAVPLNFDELCELLNIAGVGGAERADAATRFADSMEDRVLSTSPIYDNARHGPNMHFLALLDEFGLDARGIADVLDELPRQERFEHALDWEDECDKAARAVYVRVQRALSKLQSERSTREAQRRVPLERRVLVLYFQYVEDGQQVSLHLRSRGPL